MSEIAGHGLFSLCNVRGGQCVFTALLPDEPIESAFAVLEYSCYRHIIHKDGLTALAIDPGSKMRGNVWACKADNDIRLLRLLNHYKHPNVELIIDDAAEPFWFEPVAGANYGPWYTCTIKAVTDIKKGDEIVFRYFDAPKEWDE